jgi:hypothetical protein
MVESALKRFRPHDIPPTKSGSASDGKRWGAKRGVRSTWMPTLRTISEFVFQYLTKASNPLVLLQGAHGHNVLAASRHLKTKAGVEEASLLRMAAPSWPFVWTLKLRGFKRKHTYRKLLLLCPEISPSGTSTGSLTLTYPSPCHRGEPVQISGYFLLAWPRIFSRNSS